jgi:phosphoribosylglycinamide formyltransferase-1
MLKVGVLVSGGGTNLQAIIDKIESGYINNAAIVTVVSSNPNAYAIERAKKHNIPYKVITKNDFESRELFDEALMDHFKSLDVDLIVLAGFMLVLGKRFIQVYHNRIINVHPALIPSFCGMGFYGLKVHEAVLKHGVKVTGATVHFVDEGTDTGPILLQKAVYINEDDTPQTLQKRVMEEAEWAIFPEAVKLISEGKIKLG